MLGGVLDRLEAAEVRRRLDADRVPPVPCVDDLDGLTRDGAKGRGHALLLEQRGVDAARELHQRRHRVGGRLLLRGQQRLGPRWRRHGQRRCQSQVDRQRDEVLLRAVVQVPLESLSLFLAGLDHAGPRAPKLLDSRAELRVEPRVLE